MKNKNLSWFAALLVFALLLWCTAATPGKIADPSTYTCAVYSTIFSLLPPVIAIVLALNTKEVYTSLLVGIASGALLYANGNLELAINTLFFNEDGGMVAKLSDSSNVGILIFLVMLGILVALMNKAGGSAAFGRWASTHIHSRAGAQFATLLLGVMIFVDDYFNCLTVGSVMRPVTDRQKVSRAKLAYLIDATAAPVCMIAPVSSWAAAVSGYVQSDAVNGIEMFIKQIPWNYYCLLTLLMIVVISVLNIDYGPMLTHEYNAQVKNDLFTTPERPFAGADDYEEGEKHSSVLDLLVPVIVLIVLCIIGLIWTGGMWDTESENYHNFIMSFSDATAGTGLCLGSIVALVFTFIYYWLRGLIGFTKSMESIPNGFIQMISPILILCFAWTLCGLCRDNGLQVGSFVEGVMANTGSLAKFLPAVIFIVACFIGFATGTSWGTMGTMGVALMGIGYGLGMSPGMTAGAVLSGAYFGDKMSPLSDTTNLAPAMAGTDVMTHVKAMILPTGITYAITLIFFGVLGVMQYHGGDADMSRVIEFSNALNAAEGGIFNINPLLLLPPVIVIVAVAMKVPAIPGITLGIVAGVILGLIFQPDACTLGTIFDYGKNGYYFSEEALAMFEANLSPETSYTMTRLLESGGIMGMMSSVSMTIIAMMFGGIMEETHQLEVIVNALKRSEERRVGKECRSRWSPYH